MGLPARKMETHAEPRRPRLTVVTPPARKKPASSTRKKQAVACRSAFRAWAFVLVTLTLFGLGRVGLSAQAAEASLEVGRLRNEIKTERFRGSELEVQESALMSPSRIQAIAGASMGMAGAGQVSYIRLDDAPATSPAATATPVADPRTATHREGPLASALTKAMDLAAGEAHVLLVGDVGLASTP